MPILSPKPGEKLQAIVLSKSLLWAPTHFFDKRTKPHTLPKGTCEGCQRKLALRWKGYLAGWQVAKGRLCLIEVTTGAYEACTSANLDGSELRGLLCTLSRPGASVHGRVRVSFERKPGIPEPQPPFDVKTALLRVWGMAPGTPPADGGTEEVPY